MRILAVRDPYETFVYEIVADHVRATAPDLQLVTRSLADTLPPLSGFDLCVPWLQDPCDDRPEVLGRALWLQDACDAAGIPLINRPSMLSQSRKSVAAGLMSVVPGLRVPRMQRITDVATFVAGDVRVPWPFFVREDATHATRLTLIESIDDLHGAVAVLDRMCEPVAVEYIDTCTAGLFRKYRYAVVGDCVLPLHLQVSLEWITRGENRLFTATALAEERAFVAGQVQFAQPVLRAAAAACGFDFCAFDCGYVDGALVVWEVNPLPMLHYTSEVNSRGVDVVYRNVATRRVLDATVSMFRAKGRS